MRRATPVVLPHGLSTDGSAWLRSAELQEVSGYDEEQVIKSTEESAFSRSIALLQRLTRFGDDVEYDKNGELVDRLTVGDVTALMLHLRRVTFGERLDCQMACPACGEEMSVELTVGQLLQTPVAEPRPTHGAQVGGFVLKLRAVTVADLEALNAPKKTEDGISPAERLVRLCVIGSEPSLPAKIEDELLAGISSKLSELDPQADLLLDLVCPSCTHRFISPFFPEDFVLREIDARHTQLEKEVHWLAFNYHWSEEAILALPMTKRKRYIDLVNRTLAGESL